MDKDILLRHQYIIEDALSGYEYSIEKEIAKDERIAARCTKAKSAEAWRESAVSKHQICGGIRRMPDVLTDYDILEREDDDQRSEKMMTKEEFVEAVLSLLEEEIILGGDE